MVGGLVGEAGIRTDYILVRRDVSRTCVGYASVPKISTRNDPTDHHFGCHPTKYRETHGRVE